MSGTPCFQHESYHPDCGDCWHDEPAQESATAEGEAIPDRVSLEEDSPHFFADWPRLGVRINGGESKSVVEFCVSEGWARTQIFHGGRPKRERGRFVTVLRRGAIEPYWRAVK